LEVLLGVAATVGAVLLLTTANRLGGVGAAVRETPETVPLVGFESG
jgi:hypothetical protein